MANGCRKKISDQAGKVTLVLSQVASCAMRKACRLMEKFRGNTRKLLVSVVIVKVSIRLRSNSMSGCAFQAVSLDIRMPEMDRWKRVIEKALR